MASVAEAEAWVAAKQRDIAAHYITLQRSLPNPENMPGCWNGSSRRDSSAWGGVVARRLGRLQCASARLGNCRRRRGAPGKRGAHLGL